jgi:hypothetical protein
MNLSGVITGDIVASRKHSGKNREKLYSDLRRFMATLKAKGWISSFEMYRGDSIQCISTNQQNVLRVALMIRSWMKSYSSKEVKAAHTRDANRKQSVKGYFSGKQDIRLAIGIGKIDFLKSRLRYSDGEAFHLSGQGLDRLKNTPGRMIVQTPTADFNEMIEPSILLLDAVLEKWTNNQAEITLYKLRDYKEEQIALEIGISQSAVSQRTKTSQWNAIEKLVTWFEKTTKDWQV